MKLKGKWQITVFYFSLRIEPESNSTGHKEGCVDVFLLAGDFDIVGVAAVAQPRLSYAASGVSGHLPEQPVCKMISSRHPFEFAGISTESLSIGIEIWNER